jgi:phospholipid/cholesterol/gamma-HCH transport system substrate-binding protein
MTAARALRHAVLLVVGLLALTSCRFDIYSLPLPGGADTGDHPMTVTVEFGDVLDLVPESSVKVADVTVGKVTKVDLPANAVATIRQTSLLGEKFVSLAPPTEGASTQRLANHADIPLEHTGRNPEVEEVLSALSLILNGGGVAQLKTISHELNLALEGNEGSARSVLTQLSTLVSKLEQNKGDIVHAIESVNRLAVSVEKQLPAIDAALEQLPSALDSLNRQRDDLVKMLKALAQLSDVGVRVIKASKVSTIDAFHQLDPVLTALADAGDALPNALQIFFTYPFPDANLISRDPQAARNLHMGDYVNLSVQLDVDLSGGTTSLPGLPTGGTTLPLCGTIALPVLCPSGTSSGGTTSTNPLDQITNILPKLRPAPGAPSRVSYRDLMKSYDPDLVSLLVPGVAR